jgi:uncharacterized protein YcbK (DUF882 family)
MDQATKNRRAAATVLGAALLALVLQVSAVHAGWFGGFDKPLVYDLAFYNMHTHETKTITYRRGDAYNAQALNEINRIMGDYRTGDVHEIDVGLLDLLTALKTNLEEDHRGLAVRFNVFSGYRSPGTNAMLRRMGGSQAERSLHILGKAIDINVPGVDLSELRNAAWCLHRGGVGYYPADNFVHVDTGKKRYWGWDPVAGHARCHDSYLVNQ